MAVEGGSGIDGVTSIGQPKKWTKAKGAAHGLH